MSAACRSRKGLSRSVGGETGRGTRATVRGTQKTEPRARGAGDAGAGPRVRVRVRVRDAEHGTRKTRAWGAGRKTRNAEHVKRGRGQQNTGNAGTGRRRRGIGDGAQAPVHGPQRDCIHPPGPATTCRDRSQPGAIRRGPHPTCRAYESESRRCRRARRTCCCRAAPRPT